MDRTWMALGAAFALLAVAAGAFGTHALEDRISADDLDTFQTAARYHMYHAIALCIVALASARFSGSLLRAAGWLFLAGMLIFSGSVYALALGAPSILGAVAPIGGACMLSGWACLGLAAWRS